MIFRKKPTIQEELRQTEIIKEMAQERALIKFNSETAKHNIDVILKRQPDIKSNDDIKKQRAVIDKIRKGAIEVY